MKWFSRVQDGSFKGNAGMTLPEWPWPSWSDFDGAVDVWISESTHSCVLSTLGLVRVKLGLYLIMVWVCRLLGT